MNRLPRLAGFALAYLVSFPLASDAAELSEAAFTALHAAVHPGEEAWTAIPWQTSLIPAQHLAIEERKPLFVWAMDGHPMGCT